MVMSLLKSTITKWHIFAPDFACRVKSKKIATERMLKERDETVRALVNDLDRMQREVI